MIKLEIDRKDFERILLPLASMPKEIRGALWQAVKRSLDTVKTELATGIQKNSFLPKRLITDSITKPQMYGTERRGNIITQTDHISGAIRVASRNIALDNFKLVPNRITARKGRSTGWKAAGFKIGPQEAVQYRDRGNGLSKGFVLRGKNGLKFFQNVYGQYRYEIMGRRRNKAGDKRGMRRGKRLGLQLFRPASYTVQYFASFDRVQQSLALTARERFERTLLHEVTYRLGKLQ